jgi:glycerophosphoryl diester phosphodiesterase
MAAFEAAVALGFRYLETDVHATADGVLLAFHDHRLDRVTDGTGEVSALPWDVVRRARIGGTEPIPALEEVLGAWPHARLNIDVKAVSAVRPLVEVLRRTNAHDRVCVASFSDRRRRAVLAALDRPVTTSGGATVVTAFVVAAATGSGRAVRCALADVQCLQVPERSGPVPVLTARTLAAAHAAGVPVHVWTVDDAPSMHRLLDLGVDGLVTGRADTLREVLLSRGTWAP